MRLKDLEAFCLSFPGATMNLQWGDHHVYKVGKRMFVVIGMAKGKFNRLSFKAGPSFEILAGVPGITPSPYMKAAKWVVVEQIDTLPPDQLKGYIARSYAQVVATLSKKMQAELASAPAGKPQPKARAKAKAKPKVKPKAKRKKAHA
jgi:predicted DNA-binding protein (MmcQ/YjbR family)